MIKTYEQFVNEERELYLSGTKINASDISLSIKNTSNFDEFLEKIQDLYNLDLKPEEIKKLDKEYQNIIN